MKVWRDFDNIEKTLTVCAYSLFGTLLAVISTEKLSWLSSSNFETILIGTVALTSLYIAFQRFVIQESHSVQIFCEKEVSPINHADNPIKEVTFSVVNTGNRPITVRRIPFMYSRITDEGVVLGYTSNELNEPIGPAEKKTFKNIEDVGGSIFSYNVLEPECLNSRGDKHKTILRGNPGSSFVPDELSDEFLKVQKVERKMADRLNSRPLFMEESSRVIDLEDFLNWDSDKIVDVFLQGFEVDGKLCELPEELKEE